MPAKKVNFKASRPSQPDPTIVEQFVSGGKNETEQPVQVETLITQPELVEKKIKMKRLTLDLPESLHRAIKKKAVEEGVAMADLLRELLEQHFYENQ